LQFVQLRVELLKVEAATQLNYPMQPRSRHLTVMVYAKIQVLRVLDDGIDEDEVA
jgi:hypothetical protein